MSVVEPQQPPPAAKPDRMLAKLGALIALIGVAAAGVWMWRTIAQMRDLSKLGSEETPAVVVLSPSHGAGVTRATLDRLGQLISEKAGVVVVVHVAKSPVDAIETIGTSRAELALLNLTEYVLAKQEFKVEPRLQVLREREPRDVYYGVTFVRADSDIKGQGDLVGERIAFVDEYSVSGFIYPAVAMMDTDVRPEFAGSHERAIELVKNGTVAAACTYEQAVEKDSALRVIGKSKPIPNEPLVVRHDLDDVMARRLLDAVVAVSAAADGAALVKQIADIAGFQPITAAAYEDATRTLRSAGRTVEELVPGGRSMVIWSNPILSPGPD